jgi:hypothetical protein
MPRPKSNLVRYMLMLSPDDLATLDRVAETEDLRTDSGDPNRSAAARHLLRQARRRLDRAVARAEKNSG